MKIKLAALTFAWFYAIHPSFADAPSPKKAGALVDRVESTGFIQLEAESFQGLDAKQRQLAYWLSQAAIAIDPIIYDQVSRFGLREKRLLEEIVARPEGIDRAALAKIIRFTKLFWANRGNHNDGTSQKFLPEFSSGELEAAALMAQKNGALKTNYADLPPLKTTAALKAELAELKASLFDPDFEPMTTAKSPKEGKDIIEASSNTFYSGVRLADLANFHAKFPLNSRVVKGKDGKLTELVYRAGTSDGPKDKRVPPGLYATYLRTANNCLEKARSFASPAQAAAIALLIRFYQTGEFADWLAFGAAWVQNDAPVDFASGFIEIYLDAHGQKGSAQSFVTITDQKVTESMSKLAQSADYFEAKAPWDAKYKKTAFKAPVVKAVEAVIETGDFGLTTIGDNLPNENEIHEKYGTKNFLFTASSRALTEATVWRPIEEFGASTTVIERQKKYGEEADDLMTAMHEIIGHGSGKMSERLKEGSEPQLKEYYSTMEEARADLMALWNIWDPKLKELGLITNQEEVAKAMYDDATVVVLQQLRRIPKGDTIEEDHQRNRALIANYLIEKTGAVRAFQRGGKSYVDVTDYPKMRAGVGQLLAELMRIKAEGDYAAVKALIDRYGVHFDPKVRDEVVKRYATLDLPTYWAGINPRLRLTTKDKTTVVEIDYPRDAITQFLGYASMYDPGLVLTEDPPHRR